MFMRNEDEQRLNNAPVLNYNLPDAIAYTGTYITELEFDGSIFKDEVKNRSDANTFSAEDILAVADTLRDVEQLRTSLAEARRNLEVQGESDPALEIARRRFEQSQALWHRTQQLMEKGLISEQEFENAKFNFQEAERLWQEEQTLSTAIADSVREMVRKLEVAESNEALKHPLKAAFETAKSTGFFDPQYFPNVRGATTVADREAAKSAIDSLSTEVFLRQVAAGEKLNIYRTLSGEFRYNFIPNSGDGASLLLIEEYRLSSFHGDYGVGRTLKTFTLLPGEKTTISLQTYKRRTENARRASSILDSYSKESANDFESSVQREQSNKSNVAKSFSYRAEAEAEANWGWGSAKVSGGVSGSSRSSRQQFSKNVFNATSKHAARASAQRDVEVNTSYEVRTEEGEETSVKREISNVNSSRTLNFIFRQLNQEFITVLHLVDIRVGFYNGYPPSSRELPLHELDTLLDEVVDEDQRETVAKAVIAEIKSIVRESQFQNHGDFIQPVREEAHVDEGADRYFVNPYFTSSYRDDAGWRCALVTSEQGLNIRQGAGMQYPEIGALGRGTQLEANYSFQHQANGHSWVQVRTSELEGWASTTYLDLCAPYDAPRQNNSKRTISVPGIILGVDKYVMRTDSVHVDSILGDGAGLEPTALRSQELDNEVRQLEIEQYRLMEEIVRGMSPEQKASIVTQLFVNRNKDD